MTAVHQDEQVRSVKQPADRAALSMNEVAELLGVSYQTVRKLVREGVIRSVSVGAIKRVPFAALDEFLGGAS